MTSCADVVGTLEMDSCGRIEFPEKYQDRQQVVIRTPTKTEVHQGQCIQYYNTENDLDPGQIQFKAFGEEPEIYEIENFDEHREPTESSDTSA